MPPTMELREVSSEAHAERAISGAALPIAYTQTRRSRGMFSADTAAAVAGRQD